MDSHIVDTVYSLIQRAKCTMSDPCPQCIKSALQMIVSTKSIGRLLLLKLKMTCRLDLYFSKVRSQKGFDHKSVCARPEL